MSEKPKTTKQRARRQPKRPAPVSFFALDPADGDELRFFSVSEAAERLGVNYFTLSRRVALVDDLSKPLPVGKTVRAVGVALTPGARPLARIPASELKRLLMIKREVAA